MFEVQRHRHAAGHPGAAARPSIASRRGHHRQRRVRSPADVAYEGGSGYVAAKHAVAALTETLRLELVDQPVRVEEIAPGMVRTEEFALTRFGGDQERADAVYAGVSEPLVAAGHRRGDRAGWSRGRPTSTSTCSSSSRASRPPRTRCTASPDDSCLALPSGRRPARRRHGRRGRVRRRAIVRDGPPAAGGASDGDCRSPLAADVDLPYGAARLDRTSRGAASVPPVVRSPSPAVGTPAVRRRSRLSSALAHSTRPTGVSRPRARKATGPRGGRRSGVPSPSGSPSRARPTRVVVAGDVQQVQQPAAVGVHVLVANTPGTCPEAGPGAAPSRSKRAADQRRVGRQARGQQRWPGRGRPSTDTRTPRRRRRWSTTSPRRARAPGASRRGPPARRRPAGRTTEGKKWSVSATRRQAEAVGEDGAGLALEVALGQQAEESRPPPARTWSSTRCCTSAERCRPAASSDHPRGVALLEVHGAEAEAGQEQRAGEEPARPGAPVAGQVVDDLGHHRGRGGGTRSRRRRARGRARRRRAPRPSATATAAGRSSPARAGVASYVKPRWPSGPIGAAVPCRSPVKLSRSLPSPTGSSSGGLMPPASR